MADNFIRCEGCGITFIGGTNRRCPNCGADVTLVPTAAAASAQGGRRSPLAQTVPMRFDGDRVPLKNLITVVAFAAVLAIFCIVLAISAQRSYKDMERDYEEAYGIVYDGEFQELMDIYHDIEYRVNNGGSYTNKELQAYREIKALLEAMPSDVYSLLSKSKGALGYLNALTVVYVVDAALLIIMGVLVLLRFRLSFRAVIVTAIAVVIAEIVTDIWGIAVYGASLNIHRYILFAAVILPLIRECIGNDMLINVGRSEAVKPAEQPVGAAMPVVKELYSFEDMPELSGMKGLEEAQPIKGQDADDDDVMDEIAPIGVEHTRSEAPVYTPSEVAPDVEPVVPLTNYQVGGSLTDEGENVAVTPLARPMFEVDMMEDEAMPAIGGDVPEDDPAMIASADMSAPIAEKPAGIWFCSVCGNLNEHVKVCNGCGSPMK